MMDTGASDICDVLLHDQWHSEDRALISRPPMIGCGGLSLHFNMSAEPINLSYNRREAHHSATSCEQWLQMQTQYSCVDWCAVTTDLHIIDIIVMTADYFYQLLIGSRRWTQMVSLSIPAQHCNVSERWFCGFHRDKGTENDQRVDREIKDWEHREVRVKYFSEEGDERKFDRCLICGLHHCHHQSEYTDVTQVKY